MPQYKGMHFGDMQFGYFKLALGVKVSVNGCLSFNELLTCLGCTLPIA